MQQRVRSPAVAGMFYPADPPTLKAMLDGMLSAATANHADCPKALVVPHAGYIYSGRTAAAAYARLDRQRIRRVVLLGPVHRVPVRGLALPEADCFATPLGTVPLDRAGMQAIEHLPQVSRNDLAHQQEHSLEVQLPFLQRSLDAFTLLPLAVGDASEEEVAEVLAAVWDGEETLILISSDLSHFHPYAEAQHIDGITADAILHMRTPIHHEQACGATPVNGLLHLASQRGMRCLQLDLRNSGDTAGDHDRVVGYGAFAFYEGSRMQPEASADAKGPVLLSIARNSIAAELGEREPEKPPDEAWLSYKGASFVTLHKHGSLRGCIGSLQAHRPLGEDVAANALSAAFHDPRFPPLARDELGETDIEVSVLSTPEPVFPPDEAALMAQLRPGVDGVILEYGAHRSTFLPQVWEQLPSPELFLAHLKQKGGLPVDFWHPDMRVSRYTVQSYAEQTGK